MVRFGGAARGRGAVPAAGGGFGAGTVVAVLAVASMAAVAAARASVGNAVGWRDRVGVVEVVDV